MATILLCLVGCAKNPTNGSNGEKESANSNTYYTAEDYVKDPSLFVPVWADDREVPAEMLDFEEKYEQFFTPNGRTMSSAHRGDNANYPECSTEAFLSAIMAGADLVEVDIAVTKDGVLIVMHDDTIARTTNVEQLRVNNTVGIPESNNISDWTLAQLRRLRLMSADGSEVTNYVIPTLEDIIILCKDRCFITLDKMTRFEWYNDIMPLLEKHDAYRTVMLPYSYTGSYSYDRVKVMMDDIKEASGKSSALMSRAHDISVLEQTSKWIEEYEFPRVIRCGEYNEEEVAAYEPYFNKFRIHIECLDEANDTLEDWTRIDEQGFNLIVTNDIYGLTEFIQNNYFNN